MQELYFMVTIADRMRLTEFVSLYKENAIIVSFISLGYGTASSDILNYLGLDTREKAVCFAVVTDTVWKKTKKDLYQKL